MPGDIRRHARQELGQALDLFGGIVESWNKKSDDLEPKAHFVKCAYGVQNGLESSAELPVMAIIKALQIDLVEVYPRANVIQNLGRAVPIRHISGHEPGSLSLLEYRDGPFARNQRLVIGAYHDLSALFQSHLNELLRSGTQRWRNSRWIA